MSNVTVHCDSFFHGVDSDCQYPLGTSRKKMAYFKTSSQNYCTYCNVIFTDSGLRDYVRAGCVSGLSNDVFISGSYDHTVKVWDARYAIQCCRDIHVSDVKFITVWEKHLK